MKRKRLFMLLLLAGAMWGLNVLQTQAYTKASDITDGYYYIQSHSNDQTAMFLYPETSGYLDYNGSAWNVQTTDFAANKTEYMFHIVKTETSGVYILKSCQITATPFVKGATAATSATDSTTGTTYTMKPNPLTQFYFVQTTYNGNTCYRIYSSNNSLQHMFIGGSQVTSRNYSNADGGSGNRTIFSLVPVSTYDADNGATNQALAKLSEKVSDCQRFIKEYGITAGTNSGEVGSTELSALNTKITEAETMVEANASTQTDYETELTELTTAFDAMTASTVAVADGYYYIRTIYGNGVAGMNAYYYVQAQSGLNKYYKANAIADADKTDPTLIYHVYPRGRTNDGQYLIKNCGSAGKTYLDMNNHSDAWSQVAFTSAPDNGYTVFGFTPRGQHNLIKAKSMSNYIWRHGGDANGVTTSTVNQNFDEGRSNEFVFESIDASLLPWAKYCEEVNTDLGYTEGTDPGNRKASSDNSFLPTTLTYDESTDYTTALTSVQTAMDNILVPLEGTFKIAFLGNTYYWKANNSGSDAYLGYGALDATDANYYFKLTKGSVGYVVKSLGSTDKPYIQNANTIGSADRSTLINLVSSQAQENLILPNGAGSFRVYAANTSTTDNFGYNLGSTANAKHYITTILNNVPYDLFSITQANAVIKQMSSAGIATFYSDFNVTVPTGITAYPISSYDADNGKLVAGTAIAAGGVLPAAQGYIIYGDVGNYVFPATDGTSTVTSILKGSATDVAAGGLTGTNYMLANNAGNVQFYYNTDNALNAFCAYFQLVSGGSKKYVSLEIGNPSAIQAVKKEGSEEIFYNLQGQRVSEPTRGIYIVNGIKVFKK